MVRMVVQRLSSITNLFVDSHDQGGRPMSFLSIDHVGVAVTDLEVSVPWWTRFLEKEPFMQGTWIAADVEDYVGKIVGYPNCDMSGAFWALPGGAVLEMLQYHNPPPGRVNMATYNAGNTHLCLETEDIHRDYERMRDHAVFVSPEPVRCAWGRYEGALTCYLRDPDDISIELIQFAEGGRPFEVESPFVNPYG
jgi:catechol 2,3-dioxygenase-like lactoylglutathione lyase family enzyme